MDIGAENRECDEQSDVKCPIPQTDYALRPRLDAKSWEVQSPQSDLWRLNLLTAEQISNAIYIARSLAMAYVMDQVDTFAVIFLACELYVAHPSNWSLNACYADR